MRIFEDIEMEFFDPMDVEPANNETVIIFLKENVPRLQLNLDGLVQCRFIKYKTVPPKFENVAGYSYKKFTMQQVQCWGRIKKL